MGWSVANAGIVSNSGVRFQALISIDDKHTVCKSFLQDDFSAVYRRVFLN